MTDAIHVAVTVPRLPESSFALFTEQLGRWWPREYTWSQGALEEIGIEPREGGFCYERGPHGFRCDWGRVLVWAPPHRLEFAWQISPRREPVPDPARASVVEVRFEARGRTETLVTLQHWDFEHHGDGAAEYRAAMQSAEGWPHILARFVAAA